ncbi:MAG: hypothetical protein EOO77_37230 [Oxalobacteraceae bacterium]|nr:MAG: hypothetical protein EOO77_37230 [Oxalobacteraceae bacterium]
MISRKYRTLYRLFRLLRVLTLSFRNFLALVVLFSAGYCVVTGQIELSELVKNLMTVEFWISVLSSGA